MRKYMYTHTHTHTHAHHIHIYTHTHTHTIYIYIYIYSHLYISNPCIEDSNVNTLKIYLFVRVKQNNHIVPNGFG